jgi:hypothetical protein
MSGPLDPVVEWYEMARDSLRVALRVVERAIPKAISQKHVLHGLALSEATSRIRKARQELDNMALVALVAVFERVLREYLTDHVVPHLRAADSFDQGVRDQVTEDIEFWNVSACVIDKLFKHRVAGNLCGMIKQILDYRNQVAQGRVQGTPPPGYAGPATAYKRLHAFLRDGGVIPP